MHRDRGDFLPPPASLHQIADRSVTHHSAASRHYRALSICLRAPIVNSRALPITLRERMSAEDDPALWEQVLTVLPEDASILEAVQEGTRLYAEVGACSHWLRPHQTRWTAAGGFAWPTGYGGTRYSRMGLPAFDWIIPEKLPTRHSLSVRVAIPSRTTRHRQAAVNTVWPPKTLDGRRERSVFYGLRNLDGVWELKACSNSRERSSAVTARSRFR
jgi:hypothetical protein